MHFFFVLDKFIFLTTPPFPKKEKNPKHCEGYDNEAPQTAILKYG